MFLFYFLLTSIGCLNFLYAEQEIVEKKQTVCLNMIVKDESTVIKRCLESVKPIIDYWVIVDTGSTDDTREIIKEVMKDIPGNLYEKPWKNFEVNRNQALELARGKSDYILLIDADEILEYVPSFAMPKLESDSYSSVIFDAGSQYDRTLLVKSPLNWKWHGVLHEYIAATEAKSAKSLEGVSKISNREGARSADPQKYRKDAQILEEALKEDPNNSRYVFYLAQSYKDAGEYALSLKNYEKRISMGGWDQEIFYSMLMVARLQEILEMEPEVFLKSYYDAFNYRPTRVEPLYYLAKYYRSKNDFASAFLIASIGMNIPFPKDILFIEKWIYDYDIQLECSISAYWIGKYDECIDISRKLLAKSDSLDIKDLVKSNMNFAVRKKLEQSLSSMKKDFDLTKVLIP